MDTGGGKNLQTNRLNADGTISTASLNRQNVAGAGGDIVFAPNTNFVYVTAASPSRVLGFSINNQGQFTEVANVAIGTRVQALATSPDGRFLFVLDADTNELLAFRIEANGGLTQLGTALALPRSGPTSIAVGP
ncbi:MAG: beta-propeller fold lactonase family protein [Armatimonadetes bacterium]|nr:beta-propeller fold lactonase family protein [Armatimonadota bacterium]